MIIDRTEQMGRYTTVLPALSSVIKIIQSGTLDDSRPGTYATDNPLVHYIISSYTTKLLKAEKWEVHHKECDVQILLSGKEAMDCAWASPVTVISPYNETIDAEFIAGTTATMLHAIVGTFVIFFPGEPHSPCLVDEKPSVIKKVVFKITI
ncbi:MAG: YhcH/YjgK/YiaL family protein [Sphaerochaetaceae bacterium]|jgi:biofilm protein TabA